jgi:2-dehydropantoate 2-reductase
VKIAVVGAGALGLTFAAALAPVHDVIVLARRTEVVDALRRDGITVETDGRTSVVPVRATIVPDDLHHRDAWLVAVKAYATRDALAPLAGALPTNVLVASIQNGIDFAADARATLGPAARLAPGTTMQGATLLGPTHVRAIGRGHTTFARVDPPGTSSDELAAAFVAAGLRTEVVGDIDAHLWRKLLVNAVINPLGALSGRPNGTIADDDDVRALGHQLADEAAAVAAREGYAITSPWTLVEDAARATAANRNSMLQDLEAGRRTEVEAISGAIVRRAAVHGIPVPLTQAMLRLVRARERAD